MSAPLEGRRILLGVTGGIAAYKACDLVSRLKKAGADVRVILTEHAARFVPPLTFQTLSGNPVADGMFGQPAQWELRHISWAKWAEAVVVAPATANLMAKYACGIADDMLTSTLLAVPAPVLLAPAMNANMWRHPATRDNLKTLLARGVHMVGPGRGHLACGDDDDGRMAEPADIAEAVQGLLCAAQDLKGMRVLVTAGPTREALDPVRYISNHSSGKMGYALAEAAAARGAQVTLVTGPVSLVPPAGVRIVPVTSTEELLAAVLEHAPAQDIIIQAAAPADFCPAQAAEQKIKKQKGEPLTLTLQQTPDVAAAVGKARRPGQTLVIFAAETQRLEENAREKMARKNADLVVANDVTREGAGFGADTNIVTLLDHRGAVELPKMTKRARADAILTRALQKGERV